MTEGTRPVDLSRDPRHLAASEVQRAAERGAEVLALRRRLERTPSADPAGLAAVAAEAAALASPAAWPHFEQSDEESVFGALPAAGPARETQDDDDRLAGAWYGRIIGNLMGKPLEIGPTRTSIRRYLRRLGEYPLRGYVPFPDGEDPAELGRGGFERVTRGRIDGGVRDDDVDYTIVGLRILEQHGLGFRTADVADAWLALLPFHQVYTAERVAYRNLVSGAEPDAAGAIANPFQEWIGALIRADVFGFVAPGDPRLAARLAYRDAFLSHRANGIYGALWAAALISHAFVASSPEDSVLDSLRHIPPTSRLAAEVRAVHEAFTRGDDWEAAVDAVERRHPETSWVHTVNNAGALTAALLWGDGDVADTVGLAVQAGLDTDSIGATAGAWAGAFRGFAALPRDLVEPLRDTYDSGVFGEGRVSISALVSRTAAVRAQAAREERPEG